MNYLPFIVIPAALMAIPAFLIGAFAFSGICLVTLVVGAGIQEILAD